MLRTLWQVPEYLDYDCSPGDKMGNVKAESFSMLKNPQSFIKQAHRQWDT